MTPTNLKRGTRIEYTYAGGKVVSGRIVRQHKADMADWFVCKVADEVSEYSGSFHVSQIRSIDNRG